MSFTEKIIKILTPYWEHCDRGAWHHELIKELVEALMDAESRGYKQGVEDAIKR